MANSAKDHDTSMALAWAFMLSNDVATLRDDQRFASDVASSSKCCDLDTFQISFLILDFFVFLLCRAFRGQRPSRTV